MESLQDISNRPTAAVPGVTKTFERRRKQTPVTAETPSTPLSSADSTKPHSATPSTGSSTQSSTSEQRDVSPRHTSGYQGLHRGRRSSILPAAAVPGHAQCREAPASRSLLLQKMSKARRKAYLAYTKKMAEYFAEVDEFELVEESPTAATGFRTRAKAPAAQQEDVKRLPFAHASTPISPDYNASKQQSSSRGSVQATHLASRTPELLYSKRCSLEAQPTADDAAECSSDTYSAEAVEHSTSLAANGSAVQQQKQQPDSPELSITAVGSQPSSPAVMKLWAATPATGQQQLSMEKTAGELAKPQQQVGQKIADASNLSAATPFTDQQLHMQFMVDMQPMEGSQQQHRATSLAAATPATSQQQAQSRSPVTAATEYGQQQQQQMEQQCNELPATDLARESFASNTPYTQGQNSVIAKQQQLAAPGSAAAMPNLYAGSPSTVGKTPAATTAEPGTACSALIGPMQLLTVQSQQQGSDQAAQLDSLSQQRQPMHLLTDLSSATPVDADQPANQQTMQKSVEPTKPSARQQQRKQQQRPAQDDHSSRPSGHEQAQVQQLQEQQLLQHVPDLASVTPTAAAGVATVQVAEQPADQQHEHLITRGPSAEQQQQQAEQYVRQLQGQQHPDLEQLMQQLQLDKQWELPGQQPPQQLDDHQVQQLLQQFSTDAAAQQLVELQLAAAAAASLSPLQRMLQACGQSVEVDKVPCMRDFLSDITDMKEIIKLGEGTYGEAFKAPSSGIVFKLVPMEGDNLINGFEQKKAGDLLAEAIIASTLSGLTEECDLTGQPYPSHTNAFVKTHKVGVCRGPYPQSFVKAWKAWDKRNKSENDPIAKHPKEQLYAVFAMADCGRDLEGYQLRGFDQARSMMLQVALALAIAEDSLAFEHRDLHWGNVMLTPASSTYITCRFRDAVIKVRTEGAVVRLIDFTASRLQTPAGDIAFCNLEAEDGLFDGPKGKPQFETYRRMRKLTKGDWAVSHPGTNVMWMLYLAELLLSSDKPVPGATAGQKRQLREFKKRVTGYSCCGDVIWDELFAGLWSVV